MSMGMLILVSTIQRAVIVEYNHEYGNANISFHYIKGAVIVEYDREYENANISFHYSESCYC